MQTHKDDDIALFGVATLLEEVQGEVTGHVRLR
jgi:hypothetical protein